MSAGWIQTFTGRRVYPLALTPEQVCLEDIAHALALTCRWRGHTRECYSVAQHSVHVSELVAPALALAALLHDAPEAYLADLASPVKRDCYALVGGAMLEWAEAEDAVIGAVDTALGVPSLLPLGMAAIHHADLVMLATEARDLMHGTADWPWQPPAPRPEPIVCWDWREAEARFLARYRELMDAEVKP